MPEKPSPEEIKGIYQRIVGACETENAAEIARIVGSTRQAVYQWRDGKTAPEEDKLMTICEVKGVRFDWIRYGTLPKREVKSDAAFDRMEDIHELLNQVSEEDRRNVVPSLDMLQLYLEDRRRINRMKSNSKLRVVAASTGGSKIKTQKERIDIHKDIADSKAAVQKDEGNKDSKD